MYALLFPFSVTMVSALLATGFEPTAAQTKASLFGSHLSDDSHKTFTTRLPLVIAFSRLYDSDDLNLKYLCWSSLSC